MFVTPVAAAVCTPSPLLPVTTFVVVTVTVPAGLVGKGYKIRVNAHTDDVSARSSWWRPPRVHRSFAIDATTVQVANAFGGNAGAGAERT